MTGTAADIFKYTLIELRAATSPEVKFLLPLHDEVLMMVPDHLVSETIAASHKIMISPPYKLSVELKVRTLVGQDWGNMEVLSP